MSGNPVTGGHSTPNVNNSNKKGSTRKPVDTRLRTAFSCENKNLYERFDADLHDDIYVEMKANTDTNKIEEQNRQNLLKAIPNSLINEVPKDFEGVLTHISVDDDTDIIKFKFLNRFHFIYIPDVTDSFNDVASERDLINCMFDLITKAAKTYAKTVRMPEDVTPDGPLSAEAFQVIQQSLVSRNSSPVDASGNLSVNSNTVFPETSSDEGSQLLPPGARWDGDIDPFMGPSGPGNLAYDGNILFGNFMDGCFLTKLVSENGKPIDITLKCIQDENSFQAFAKIDFNLVRGAVEDGIFKAQEESAATPVPFQDHLSTIFETCKTEHHLASDTGIRGIKLFASLVAGEAISNLIGIAMPEHNGLAGLYGYLTRLPSQGSTEDVKQLKMIRQKALHFVQAMISNRSVCFNENLAFESTLSTQPITPNAIKNSFNNFGCFPVAYHLKNHGIVVDLVEKDSMYQLSIYNSGGGLEYHGTDGQKYATKKTYQFVKSDDALKKVSFVLETCKGKEIDNFYVTIDCFCESLESKILPELVVQSEQKVGNCSLKRFFDYFAHSLPLDDYLLLRQDLAQALADLNIEAPLTKGKLEQQVSNRQDKRARLRQMYDDFTDINYKKEVFSQEDLSASQQLLDLRHLYQYLQDRGEYEIFQGRFSELIDPQELFILSPSIDLSSWSLSASSTLTICEEALQKFNDRDYFLDKIGQYPDLLQFADPALLADPEFCALAMVASNDCEKYISSEMYQNQEFIVTFAKNLEIKYPQFGLTSFLRGLRRKLKKTGNFNILQNKDLWLKLIRIGRGVVIELNMYISEGRGIGYDKDLFLAIAEHDPFAWRDLGGTYLRNIAKYIFASHKQLLKHKYDEEVLLALKEVIDKNHLDFDPLEESNASEEAIELIQALKKDQKFMNEYLSPKN